jgi:hypothetical protein
VDVDKTIEFILEMQAKHEVNFAKHEDMMARIDSRLDRAILYAVREARNERRKRREMDARWHESFSQLSAAQKRTEESLRELQQTVNAFLKTGRNGGNGHPQA